MSDTTGYPSTLTPNQIERLRHWQENAYAEGGAVLAELKPTDRVLDMGTGSGVNAILAAGTAGGA